MDYGLLKRLTEAPGLPGREAAVREILAGELARFRADLETDALGNLIAHVKGAGPRVLLQAHLDEVGCLVSRVDEQGFVRVMPVGVIDPRVFYGQRVVVHGREDLPGLVGTSPPVLPAGFGGSAASPASSQAGGGPAMEDCYIDLGLPAGRVAELVEIGDAVTFPGQAYETETCFCGKALDDRVGLFVLVEALGRAEKIDCDLFLVGSVQEEYGLRGAGPAAFAVQPDLAVALEGTFALDTPGLNLPANLTPTRLGLGPEIRLGDGTALADRSLVRFLSQLARERDIRHQVIIKKAGATDAGPIQVSGRGARVTVISLPVRYAHAPTSLISKSDLEETVRLAAAFLEQASRYGEPETVS